MALISVRCWLTSAIIAYLQLRCLISYLKYLRAAESRFVLEHLQHLDNPHHFLMTHGCLRIVARYITVVMLLNSALNIADCDFHGGDR